MTLREQAPDVIPHVGVVISEKDAGGLRPAVVRFGMTPQFNQGRLRPRDTRFSRARDCRHFEFVPSPEPEILGQRSQSVKCNLIIVDVPWEKLGKRILGVPVCLPELVCH